MTMTTSGGGETTVALTEEQQQEQERTGKCEACESRGPLFKAPMGRDLCCNCTSAYISWELDGGREAEPEGWAWLWEDDDEPSR